MNVRFPLIFDGATGTELQKRGFSGGGCAETWVLEHPEVLQDLQQRYLAAGSQVLYAPTFGANRVKLEENGLFGKVEEYNRKLVGLTRQVARDGTWVAADIAPTGQFLPPMGETSFEELVDIYREQAAALEAAGVDLYGIETAMTLPEARAAVLAVKSVSQKPVVVSFTCDANGKTLTGTDVVAALLVMQGMGVDAFGLNCSMGPAEMLTQLRRLQPYAEVPLLAKPNAGLPEVVDGRTVYRCTPEEFAGYARDFAGTGVMLFGGCCGTDETHIAALHESLRGVSMTPPNPQLGNRLPCATEKQPQLLPPDAESGPVLRCTETLEEDLEKALAEDFPVVSIAVTDEDDLELFADCQYAVTKALCLVCDDAALLEKALRLYQGRALYAGSLSDAALQPLAEKYGLVF